MTRAGLIDLVAAVMDEINPLSEGETILNPQIDAQLDQAAISLVQMLPPSIACPVNANPLPLSQNHKEDFSIDVVCPPDFVRLHRLKLKDWIRSVTILYPDGDRLLLLQDYVHVRSTFRRPTASLYHVDGLDILTCYPPPKEDSLSDPPEDAVEEFVYVQRPDNAQSIDNRLADLLAWNAAAIVYSIAGQTDHAELCRNRLAAMIETQVKHL